MWDVKGNQQQRCWTSRANDERCTDIEWHPLTQLRPDEMVEARRSAPETAGPASALALATGSVDSSARLFSGAGTYLRMAGPRVR